MCFKYGDLEYVKEGRYFNCYISDTLRALIYEVGTLTELSLNVSEDLRPEHQGEKWVSVVGKRG